MIKLLFDQRSEAWHSARLGRITGTAFSDVVSGEKTAGYEKLITRLAGEIITQEAEETYSNAIMERGVELEPEARKYYEDLFSIKVEEVGMCIPDEDSELHEWVGISPDGLIENAGLEIKCPLRNTHINYILENKLPNEYKWQVQGALWVTGFDYWDFMSYYPGMKPFILRVYPDINMHNVLEVRCRQAIKDIKLLIEKYKQYECY